jgi:hypothetical protein
MRQNKMIGRVVGVAAVAATMLNLACPTARAGDYQMVASGPIISNSLSSFSGTFDGTTRTTDNLPPIFDLALLAGGSFRATLRFSTEYTVNPDDGFYDLNPPSGIAFDLLNSSGAVVYHGSYFSDPIAILLNNFGSAPYVTDQVAIYGNDHNADGLVLPKPLYGPGSVDSTAGLNFYGNVSPGHDYLSDDVNIPTNLSPYLAFPNKILDMTVSFRDGDAYNQIGPYQYAGFTAQYDITALSVTPVPEPSVTCLLLSIFILNACRRRAAS